MVPTEHTEHAEGEEEERELNVGVEISAVGAG